MTAPACPRLFEAEAMRDGRLGGAERASFERHGATCPACAREIRALEALAESLRATPADRTDELRARRERTRLLAAFDGTLVTPERGWTATRRLIGSVAIAAVVAGAFVFWHARRSVQAVHTSRAVVHADATAAWSERAEADREEIVLERGALWIHVDHVSGDERLVVVLPDGDLEDTGTTFTVSAESGHTSRVAVQDGSVVLRLRGSPPVAIGPGETWAREATAASASASAAPIAASSATSAQSGAPVRSPASSAPALAPDPSADFRAAMTTLEAGLSAKAAAEFASFLVKYPRDARAEDATYLRVIALQRCGDGAGMWQAAREYLRRYPAGLRHTEVEALVGDGG